MNVAATYSYSEAHTEPIDLQHGCTDHGEFISLISSNLSEKKRSLEAQQRERRGLYIFNRIFTTIFCEGGVHLILIFFCSIYLSTPALFNATLLVVNLFCRLISGTINIFCGVAYIVRGIQALSKNRQLEGCYRCFSGLLMLCIGVLTIVGPLCIKYAAKSVIAIALTNPILISLLWSTLAICLLGEMTYQLHLIYRENNLGDRLVHDLKIPSHSQKYVHILNHCLSAVMEGNPAIVIAASPLKELQQRFRRGEQIEVVTIIHKMVDLVKKSVGTQVAIETCQLLICLSSSLPIDLDIPQQESEEQVQELNMQDDRETREQRAAQSRIKAQQDILQKALDEWKTTQYTLAAQYLLYVLSTIFPVLAFYCPVAAFALKMSARCFAALALVITFLQ